MSIRFENLKADKDQDSIIWSIDCFSHDISMTASLPAIGDLATWAPTAAYVIGYKRIPDGPHCHYEIQARSDSYIRKSEVGDGVRFVARLFLADSDSRIPVVGQLATWAPETAYIMDFKSIQAGTYKVYEIEAKTINSVLIHHDARGVWYSWKAFVTSAGMSGLPVIGTLVDWAPVDALNRKPYLFDRSEIDMLGNGSFTVNLKACEYNYDIGWEVQ